MEKILKDYPISIELVKEIGKGSFGKIYAGTLADYDGPVAIKVRFPRAITINKT